VPPNAQLYTVAPVIAANFVEISSGALVKPNILSPKLTIFLFAKLLLGSYDIFLK
jgi:hypothetical protein